MTFGCFTKIEKFCDVIFNHIFDKTLNMISLLNFNRSMQFYFCHYSKSNTLTACLCFWQQSTSQLARSSTHFTDPIFLHLFDFDLQKKLYRFHFYNISAQKGIDGCFLLKMGLDFVVMILKR